MEEKAIPKANPFGRKSVSDSRVIPSNPVAPEDDLDVPSFLRKKKI